MLTRTPLKPRSKPIRKSSGKFRRTKADIRFHDFVRAQQRCLVHGWECPMWNGGILNRWEIHHIDHNHRNHRRVVLMCDVGHDARPMPAREILEAEVNRLNELFDTVHRARYESETGRKLNGAT